MGNNAISGRHCNVNRRIDVLLYFEELSKNVSGGTCRDDKYKAHVRVVKYRECRSGSNIK